MSAWHQGRASLVGVSAQEGAAGPHRGWTDFAILPVLSSADPMESPGSQAPGRCCRRPLPRDEWFWVGCLRPAARQGRSAGLVPLAWQRVRVQAAGCGAAFGLAGSSSSSPPCTCGYPAVSRPSPAPCPYLLRCRGGDRCPPGTGADQNTSPGSSCHPSAQGCPLLPGASGSPSSLSACSGLCPPFLRGSGGGQALAAGSVLGTSSGARPLPGLGKGRALCSVSGAPVRG